MREPFFGTRCASIVHRCAGVGLLGSVLAAPASAEFKVTGSAADKATWEAMLTGCKSASASFKALVEKITGSTNKTVTIDLVRDKASVLVDAFSTNEVDLSDIEGFAEKDPPKVIDRCQVIAHFLAERWHKAENPTATFHTCHGVGIAAENAYRADMGYTDKIQFQATPLKPGHTLSADGKSICHQWVEGTTKSLTYDALPGTKTESRSTSGGGATAPGTSNFQIDPGHPNQMRIELPPYLGGGTRTLRGLSAQAVLQAGAPIPFGLFHYAPVHVLALFGDAPAVPLPVPPFSTGPNHFELDPGGPQLGIWNVDNGQFWISYHGRITNSIFPAGSPLPTYSSMTGILMPGSSTVDALSLAALLDGTGDESWSHYPLTDCNGNGRQDLYDLLLDPSLDDGSLCGHGAGNLILDACDCADCNGNGIPDLLDIQNGTSQDCRGDGIPDECDIASGAAADLNLDGVPDECQGACCLGHGSCTVLRGADCAQQGGLYHGDGTQCASGSCDCLALPYCFGDGSGTPCPCGNHDPAGAGGCANSSGFGGRLAALGSTSLSADDLQLEATHLIPNQPGLLFAGTQPVNGGSGIHFGDGLRCAGGQVRRLGVRTPDAQGRAVWGPGLGLAGGWTPGTLRFAQVWYRNPAGGPCLSGFNLTNGISIAVCP